MKTALLAALLLHALPPLPPVGYEVVALSPAEFPDLGGGARSLWQGAMLVRVHRELGNRGPSEVAFTNARGVDAVAQVLLSGHVGGRLWLVLTYPVAAVSTAGPVRVVARNPAVDVTYRGRTARLR